jgi:hypothetical protein
MPPYSDTTSYNSLPKRCGGMTYFLILPIKKSFMFFLYIWSVGKWATNYSNGLNLFVHSPWWMFFNLAEKWGCTLLKCFHTSPSKGCTITPSTTSCDWCHVMCSAVFGDMNNLRSLGVIEKSLSFLCATRVFLQPILSL